MHSILNDVETVNPVVVFFLYKVLTLEKTHYASLVLTLPAAINWLTHSV